MINEEVDPEKNPEEFLNDLFERFAAQLHLDVLFHYELGKDGRTLRLASSRGLSPDIAKNIATHNFDQSLADSLGIAGPSCLDVWTSEPVSPLGELMTMLGVKTHACCPLIAHGHFHGMICFGSRERTMFSDEELNLFQSLCAVVSMAIDRVRQFSTLERNVRELTEADRRKDEFLALLGHELRNPLAPILNSLEVLRKNRKKNIRLDDLMARMERQARHLTRLVDDLLDISRITHGQIKLSKERVEAHKILSQVVDDAQPLMKSRNHVLNVSLLRESVWLEADVTRLTQIMVNLLSNAAKYTEMGGHIRLSLEKEGTNAVIRVTDTGIGISLENQAAIFEPFTQIGRTPDQSLGGLGLGLTLAQRLVQLHGGTISVASPGVNQGSEFTVRLPLAAEPAPVAKTAVPPRPKALAECRRNVLVVEDNVDAAQSLGELLELWGHEVHLSYNGPAAVSEAIKYRPDVILLDIGLPGMDGYRVAEALRRQDLFSSALIVAVTGYGQVEDQRRSKDAGIDYHLTKPVDLAELRGLLDRHGQARYQFA